MKTLQSENFLYNEKFTDLKICVLNCEDNFDLISKILSDFGVKYKFLSLNLSEINQEEFDLFLFDIKNINIDLSCFSKPVIFFADTLNLCEIKKLKTAGYYCIEKPFNLELLIGELQGLFMNILRQKARMDKKDDFIAMLTHDLKSPIYAEIAALNMLIENDFGELNDLQSEIINEILNSAKYLQLITDRMCTFYKFHKNYVLLNKTQSDIVKVIFESVDILKFLFNSKNQKIIIHSDLCSLDMNIDIIEIKRLVQNLLANASEYSPDNSEIKIFISKSDKDFIFKIKDSGYGISKEQCKTIFNAYESYAKKHKKTGFGLGLYICRQIVLAHSGEIYINSEQGKGCEIVFTLPLK